MGKEIKILHDLTTDDLLNIVNSRVGINQNGITIEDYSHEYLGSIRGLVSENYYRSIVLTFNHLMDFRPGNIFLSSLDIKQAEAFIKFLQRKAPKGYRVYYRNIKAAFSKAVTWGYLRSNPFAYVKIPKNQEIFPEIISEAEMKEVCKNIPSRDIKSIVQFAYYTGMRISEILSLRWQNVDLNNFLIVVGSKDFKTKTRSQRIVPMCAAVRNMLEDLEEKTSKNKKQYIFYKSKGIPYNTDYISKAFKRAVRIIDKDSTLHFHSLRHSFASHLVQKGVDLYKVRDLLGHKSIKTTEIYAHQSVESLRDAINYFN